MEAGSWVRLLRFVFRRPILTYRQQYSVDEREYTYDPAGRRWGSQHRRRGMRKVSLAAWNEKSVVGPLRWGPVRLFGSWEAQAAAVCTLNQAIGVQLLAQGTGRNSYMYRYVKIKIRFDYMYLGKYKKYR